MNKVIEPGGEGEVLDIELDEDFLQRNRQLAEKNSQRLKGLGIHAVDILGSVGSGKTSIIMQMVSRLKNRNVKVIAGDLTTTIDADRIATKGAEVIQVNTGRECHLDANIVRKALDDLNLENVDTIIVENVGNLICPADFPVGADTRMVVISVTEGPYMVLKHPFIFLDADVVAINKIDLSEAMEVNPDELKAQLLKLKPAIKVIKTNGRTGEGVDDVIKTLGL